MTVRGLKWISLLLCTCLTAPFALAQSPDSSELNITATLYTQDNGLTSNMLIGTAKDSSGYLYFRGLDGKWIRFDGTNFRVINDISSILFYNYSGINFSSSNYPLQYFDSTIYKVESTNPRDTRKWALKNNALICILSGDQEREIFPLPREVAALGPLGFAPDGDNCWLSAHNKIFRFNSRSKKFQQVPIDPDAGSLQLFSEPIIPSSPGGLPYLISEKILLKLDTASGMFKKFCSFSNGRYADCTQYAILDNYLLAATSPTVIEEVNLISGTVNVIDLAEYSSIKNISALKILSMLRYRDYVLIGTSNAGLFIFNRCTRSMQHFQYEKQNSNPSLTNSVAWLAVHDENVIWMQTDGGLLKLEVNNQFMKTFLPSSVKEGGFCNYCNNVRAIYSNDNNELLVGSFEGLYSFNPSSEQFSNFLSPTDQQPVWKEEPIGAITGDEDASLPGANGNIFIASWANKGILLVNKKKKKLVNILAPGSYPQLPFTNIRCMFYDAHNILWVGTSDGFLRITNLEEFEKNNFTGELTVSNQFPGISNPDSLLHGDCFTIAGDANENVWLGTYNGLYVYNYKTGRVTKYVHMKGDDKSLRENDIRSVYISREGYAWIGTSSGGLNRFDPAKKTFTAYTTENGLSNNTVYTILEDNSGYLWLGTNAGLCRFSKADHSVRNYTPRDGIQNFEFNTNAVCETPDGKFCFGGRTGFNIFHPDSMNISYAPSQVVITRFNIFDKEFPVTDSLVKLGHNQNSFTFDFAALNYYRNNENQYAYMMTGVDKDWIKSGNRQYTSYSNLVPGEYTFKVRAANYTGAWSNSVTSMKIYIAPAWYSTWWFRVALALVIASGIFGFYKYRMRQLLKLQAVRNRIASDLHDEIGSTLSSISLSSTIIQKKLNGTNDDVKKLLQQVSNNTDNMMEALSDIVWAINTRNDRFDNVVNRMRAFGIELLEPADINIRFNVGADVTDVHLDMQERKNIYLIFKEAMNNIVKYSGCKNVWIDISRQGNRTFVMNIKDDGKGFEVPLYDGEEITLSGNGIRNMKKRAQELGGELKIDSVPGTGATLHLIFTV